MLLLTLLFLISSKPKHITLQTEMSPFKWFNILLFIEKFFGIYRNYCSQTQIKKYLIIVQIFVLTLLYTLLTMYRVYLLLKKKYFDQMEIIFISFGLATYVDCVSSVVSGICYSNAFVSYLTSVSHASEYLKDDKKIIKILKKIFYSSISFITVSFLFSVYRTTESFQKYLPSVSLVPLIPLLLLQAIIRTTVVLQHLMLYVVIMIVVHLTNSLSLLVSAVKVRVGRSDVSSDEQNDIRREKIQEWVQLYRELVNCCEKVTFCFGSQVIMLLFCYIR